jgi:hypothetical protein
VIAGRPPRAGARRIHRLAAKCPRVTRWARRKRIGATSGISNGKHCHECSSPQAPLHGREEGPTGRTIVAEVKEPTHRSACVWRESLDLESG